MGYIPAENIETPFERLARLNKHRNVDVSINPSTPSDAHSHISSELQLIHLSLPLSCPRSSQALQTMITFKCRKRSTYLILSSSDMLQQTSAFLLTPESYQPYLRGKLELLRNRNLASEIQSSLVLLRISNIVETKAPTKSTTKMM